MMWNASILFSTAERQRMKPLPLKMQTSLVFYDTQRCHAVWQLTTEVESGPPPPHGFQVRVVGQSMDFAFKSIKHHHHHHHHHHHQDGNEYENEDDDDDDDDDDDIFILTTRFG